MKFAITFVALACLSAVPPSIMASSNAYVCQVSHVYNLAEGETLKPSHTLAAAMNESSFSVSRESGQIIADSAIDTSRAKKVTVLNRGSRKNSFKATADFGSFQNGTRPFQFIEIQEFESGRRKPFILMGDIGLVTGSCE